LSAAVGTVVLDQHDGREFSGSSFGILSLSRVFVGGVLLGGFVAANRRSRSPAVFGSPRRTIPNRPKAQGRRGLRRHTNATARERADQPHDRNRTASEASGRGRCPPLCVIRHCSEFGDVELRWGARWRLSPAQPVHVELAYSLRGFVVRVWSRRDSSAGPGHR